MGIYLHSIHCSQCGASFLVNKAHDAYKKYRSSYYCPVCTFGSYTKPDDTFFNLMVSPELAKKFQATNNLLNMMDKTDPEALEKVYKALSEGHSGTD